MNVYIIQRYTLQLTSLEVFLPVYLSLCLFISLPITYLPAYLSPCLLRISLPIYLPAYLSPCLFISLPIKFYLLISRSCAVNNVHYVDNLFTIRRPGVGLVLLYMAIEGLFLFILTLIIEVCNTRICMCAFIQHCWNVHVCIYNTQHTIFAQSFTILLSNFCVTYIHLHLHTCIICTHLLAPVYAFSMC